jgi:hypothetical protein
MVLDPEAELGVFVINSIVGVGEVEGGGGGGGGTKFMGTERGKRKMHGTFCDVEMGLPT